MNALPNNTRTRGTAGTRVKQRGRDHGGLGDRAAPSPVHVGRGVHWPLWVPFRSDGPQWRLGPRLIHAMDNSKNIPTQAPASSNTDFVAVADESAKKQRRTKLQPTRAGSSGVATVAAGYYQSNQAQEMLGGAVAAQGVVPMWALGGAGAGAIWMLPPAATAIAGSSGQHAQIWAFPPGPQIFNLAAAAAQPVAGATSTIYPGLSNNSSAAVEKQELQLMGEATADGRNRKEMAPETAAAAATADNEEDEQHSSPDD
ncbi:hypothetical protein J5N97_016544 [Dioscorea zingiberensis]|uniref:Uncharacterized protein n=1 Tax=Dioscorea zingiberensis TaxID=325984 RepID=A0A9D5CKG9_9LILI|nr:hypothetical protein J5N97_016544 [Dioscorea zingiberensis]